MYKEIKKYRIFLDSGTQKNKNYTTVNLYDNEEEIIGILQFYDKGFQPKDMTDSHYIYLQYPIKKFPYIIDVLRNEGPVFIGYWENEFGKCGYYLADSFNEMEIPAPEDDKTKRYEILANFGKAVYDSIKQANPEAVWVMQGWMFGYQGMYSDNALASYGPLAYGNKYQASPTWGWNTEASTYGDMWGNSYNYSFGQPDFMAMGMQSFLPGFGGGFGFGNWGGFNFGNSFYPQYQGGNLGNMLP